MSVVRTVLPEIVGCITNLRWLKPSVANLPANNLRIGFVPLLDWHTQRGHIQVQSIMPANKVGWVISNTKAYCVAVLCLANTAVPFAIVTCPLEQCPGPYLEV